MAEPVHGRLPGDKVTAALAEDFPLVMGGAEGLLVVTDAEAALQGFVADAAPEVRWMPGAIQGCEAISEDALPARGAARK